MSSPLPPLRALIAFEAAVRLASFKQAAAELHITPGAVSQQVQKLEAWLGITLFTRQVRQLRVTEQGLAYYQGIAPALAQIRQASQQCRRSDERAVRLSLTPGLAARWLAPRMADFINRHPAIDVHINATHQTVDFQNDNIDLAIRHFDGQAPGLACHFIEAGEVLLLCSPGYRDRLNLQHPDDLQRATLLHTEIYYRWADWLDRFSNLSLAQQAAMPGVHFDQLLPAVEAAKQHQGVVLSNALLVRDELLNGELVEPFGQRLLLGKGYYLVHPKRRPLSEDAAALKAWLLAQFADTA